MLFAIRLPRTEVTLVCYIKKAMSVERQTKEMFPKQRSLCEQRRSTVASIRSCPARLGVWGTCEEKIIYAKRKKRPRSFERER